jgi:hypothetical protein
MNAVDQETLPTRLQHPVQCRLRTVQQLCKEHPVFTPGGIRWLLFHRQQNGLNDAGAVIKLGRKVLIDIDRFFQWIENQNSEQK